MQKRILYVHAVSVIGGAERELLSILSGLDREDFCPMVVCAEIGPLTQELQSYNVRSTTLSLPAWRKWRSFFGRIQAVWHLYRFMVNEDIELVHVNDMWWVPQTYFASRLAGIPCVAHIRQELEPRKVRQYWLRCPLMLIAVSSRVKQQLTEGGVAPQRIEVLYSGVNFSERQFCEEDERIIRDRCAIKHNDLIVGAVAHLFPRKGYEYLILALAKVCKVLPHVRCLIVGEGSSEYKAHLTALVARHRLENHIRFLGHQPDVFPYLQVMDLVVLPSIIEGLGIALLEAMSVSKPVIASRVGGIPEIVEDGVTGILVAPKDDDELATKMIMLLQRPELRRQMGTAGAKRVAQFFTQQEFLERLTGLYRELFAMRHE